MTTTTKYRAQRASWQDSNRHMIAGHKIPLPFMRVDCALTAQSKLILVRFILYHLRCRILHEHASYSGDRYRSVPSEPDPHKAHHVQHEHLYGSIPAHVWLPYSAKLRSSRNNEEFIVKLDPGT
eukprot:3832515-Pleurochrysis_carterae.AAC.1